ncbi:MAG TPA: hypothetical protein VHW01_14285, partial [Polyangiaceae bacterium]|nr:hypothetical protein [Polyangiaceae bacterium]
MAQTASALFSKEVQVALDCGTPRVGQCILTPVEKVYGPSADSIFTGHFDHLCKGTQLEIRHRIDS